MVFLRRKVRLDEDGIFSDLDIIKNAQWLQNLKIRAKQEFDKKMAQLKADYDKKLQDYEVKYSQLLGQQYNVTKSEETKDAQAQAQTAANGSTGATTNAASGGKVPAVTPTATKPAPAVQTNMTTANKTAANQAILNQAIAGKKNESVNEGVNGKHLLLQDIIMQCVGMLNLSYSLDRSDASRLARKINDFINSNKGSNNLYDDIKMTIKNYFRRHTKISLLNSEINQFTDKFMDILHNKNVPQFKRIFDTIENVVISFNADTNIDELENELSDLGFDIDEDYNNRKLILSNVDSYNYDELQNIIDAYNLRKN